MTFFFRPTISRTIKPASFMKKQLLLLLSMFLLVSGSLFAQGVTTSSLTGIVVDDNGAPVMLASVLAVHTPTGTQYGTYTSEDGHFDIRN